MELDKPKAEVYIFKNRSNDQRGIEYITYSADFEAVRTFYGTPEDATALGLKPISGMGLFNGWKNRVLR